MYTESFKVTIPSFNEANFSYSLTEGLQYVSQWEISQAVDNRSVSVNNVQYAPITKAELKDLDINTIPSELTYSLKTSVARNTYYAYLVLSPIIKTNQGGFKKVTSFSVSYSNGGLTTNRSPYSNRVISNSVLRSGQWYKFYIDKTGVFKITKNFLSDLGVNVDNLDPRTLKLYGNGGRMIPYANSEPYPIDVQENAIRVIGETDGVFNDTDYVLFYGQGPKGFDEVSNTNINCYTDKTYYYINVSSGHGKRVQPIVQPTGPVDLNIDTFQDYKFHEVDEYNLVNVGRRWFGDKFDIENTKTFDFSFPDLVTTEPINFKVFLGSTAIVPTTMQVEINGNDIVNLTLPATTDSNLATENSYDNDLLVNSSNLSVSLTHNDGGNPSALAYIDYISIEATRALNFSGSQFTFKNYAVTQLSGIGQYHITNTTQVSEIWDVTDIYNVKNLINSDNSSSLSFTSSLGTLKSYAIVSSLSFYEPMIGSFKTVSNQNLKGTIFQDSQGEFRDIDYLIITPNSFKGQAERLAQINRNNNQLNVKVVTLNQIYAEFSTGNQDIGAIRNFVKYVYDNASTPDKELNMFVYLGMVPSTIKIEFQITQILFLLGMPTIALI